jgi:hypothetical protein
MHPGDTVLCLDARHGAHFLRAGECYVVDTVRPSDGWVSLVGMASMWEPGRFRLVREAGAPIDPRSVTDPVYRPRL